MSILTGVIGPILINAAIEAGVPLVRDILQRKIGSENAGLVEGVITSIAKHAGVEVDGLSDMAVRSPDALKEALVATEAETPEKIALYMSGVHGQFRLLQSEQSEGGAASAWRWGWMYLLGFFWLWVVVLVPVINASLGAKIVVIDVAILLTLTSWFIALYMGGHTVKELGKSALDAVRSWRG